MPCNYSHEIIEISLTIDVFREKNVLNFKRTIDEAKMWFKQYSSIKGLYFNLKVLECTYNLDKTDFEIMFLNMI